MFKQALRYSLILSALALPACSSLPKPEGKPLPAITFEHIQKLPISVGSLRTHSESEAISESFVVSPHNVMSEYLHARFVPKGFSGSLQAVIETANIEHSYQPSSNKAGSFLDVGGLDVYSMTVKIRLEYIGQDEKLIKGSVLTGGRIVKVSEHASIAERERRQFEGMELLFKDLDEAVKSIVLGDMGLGMAR